MLLTEFHLRIEDLNAIWNDFIKLDLDPDGLVKAEQILSYLKETPISIAAPYFARFFELIEKENVDAVDFEEFAKALVVFCLYNREELVSFVFCMLDEDND